MIRTIGGRATGASPGVYKFTNRTLSANAISRGLYNNLIGFYLLLEPTTWAADVRGYKVIAEDGGALVQE